MTEDQLREWIEAEHQLSVLEQYPEWKTLLDLAAGRVDALQRKILGGNVSDLTAYKFDAGRLAGMNEILGMRGVVAKTIANERARKSEQ